MHELRGDRHRWAERHGVREHRIDRWDRVQLSGPGLQRGGEFGLLERGGGTGKAHEPDGDGGLRDGDRSRLGRQRDRRGWVLDRVLRRRGVRSVLPECYGGAPRYPPPKLPTPPRKKLTPCPWGRLR